MVNQVSNLLEDYNPTQPSNDYNQVHSNSAYPTNNTFTSGNSNFTSSYPTSYNNPSYTNTSFQSGSFNNPPVNGSYYPGFFYQNEFNSNQAQSTDSEQYLINSYYELSDQLEHQAQFYQPVHHLQQDQQFIENYHHLNHNSNQISANNHQYIYENYYTEYLANRENGLNLNSMIVFNPSLLKRMKSLCSKKLFCLLLVVLIPIFALILILICIKLINNTDKNDKDDLHQYVIYAFVIFAAFFLLPFALLVILVEIKKCFPNFISNDEPLDSNLLANNILPPQLTTTHATLTANQPLMNRALVNSNQIDLQVNLQVALPSELSGSLTGGLVNSVQTGNLQDNQQQMSTLNVNQLENNRQLINEMLEEFDQMNQIDQERTLQRMSSIQRRQRLIRQNAFESTNECSTDEQQRSNQLIYYSEDKPPSYELALLCPKRDDTATDQKPIIKSNTTTTTKNDKKLQITSSTSKSITVVNLTEITSTQTGLPAITTAPPVPPLTNNSANETNSILQTELRNNLENRRRSSNGSSNTEPPSYDKLFQEDI